ncbi:MAG TPA: hypothetical protein VGJ84_09260 [Polyangiaceae bacterium]|jgi:hypothetical protein
MAEKKPKIDLKARLGKKGVSSPGGDAVPPPIGIPKPAGIPAPPFGRKKVPKVDASDPYAAIDADVAPARAEPQAIKVELSAEVVQAQKKGRAKIIALAVASGAVAFFVGYNVGSAVERGKGSERALADAKQLTQEVDAAGAKIDELAELVKSAKAKLADGKYPGDEVSKLGAVNIPFDETNITRSNIGRFKTDTNRMLINFVIRTKEANDEKEQLQSALGGDRKGIEQLLEEMKSPKVRWAVALSPGPFGPWAAMAPVSDPFLVKGEGKDGKPYEWPEKLTLNEKKTGKRYTKGDPIASDPLLIPVNPQTQVSVCKSDVLANLMRQFRDMEEVLKGSETPGEEKEGLADLAQKLHESLKQIGTPGS